MDAEYLKRTVGAALSQGMAEVVARQPGDAIDYLGNFLINFADAQEAAKAAAAAKEQAEKEAQVQAALRAKRKALLDAQEAEQNAIQARADKLMATLETVEEVDASVYAEVLSVLQEKTSSRAAYVGQRVDLEGTVTNEEGEEQPNEAVKYIAASEGQEFMLDELLEKNSGVTFDAFKPPVVEEDEDADPDDLDENAPPKEAPKPGVFVENSLDEQRLHYFQFAKLGSYFAVPIQYQSYLHDGAVTDEALKAYTDHQAALAAAEEARIAKEQAAAEAAAAAAAEAEAKAAEGGDADGENADGEDSAAAAAADDDKAADGEDAAEAEEEPEPIPDPEYVRVPVDLVLCMDTLGMGLGVYSEEALDLARQLAAALAAALERTERAQLEAEFTALLEAQEENGKQLEALSEAQQQQTEALEEESEALKTKLSEEGVSEEDQAYEVLKLQEDAARRAVLQMQSQIKELERYKIAPKGDSMKALQAACFTLGYSKLSITDKATKKLDWTKMRKLFGNDFFVRLQGFDAVAVRKVQKYQTVASIEALLEGITVKDMNSKSVAVGSILAWNQSVITVRKAAVEKRQRDKEAAEAAAAAAEAERIAAEEAAAAEAAAAEAAAAEAAAAEAEGAGEGDDAAAAEGETGEEAPVGDE